MSPQSRLSSNITYTQNIVSMWNFISLTRYSGRSRSKVRRSRKDKSWNVQTFFPWLDLSAHYYSANSWRVAPKKSQWKRDINEKYPGGDCEEERHAATTKSQLAFFNVETSSSPSRGTLNVRIGKKVTEKKLRPLTSPDGRLQRSQIKSLKHLRSCSARTSMKNFFYACQRMGKLMYAPNNECRKNQLLIEKKVGKFFLILYRECSG